MNFQNLKVLANGMVPGSKRNVIKASTRDLILNEGARDVAFRTVCLKTNDTFNVVEDQDTYDISTEVSDFLTVDKPGLWWNDGNEWEKVNPRTLKWLDEKRPNWRDMDSDDPQDYAINGNEIIVIPKPDTSLSGGFKLYYGKKPPTMTASGHYPFGGANEIPRLAPLSWSIVAFWRWKAGPMIAKQFDEMAAKKDYLESIVENTSLINRDVAISDDKKTRYQGRIIR